MNRRTFIQGALAAASLPNATSTVTVADPLLETIRAYQRGFDEFNRRAKAAPDDSEWDMMTEETYGRHLAKLYKWDSPATTREAAVEALKLSIDDVGGVAACEGGDRMIRAAIGYLESLST